MPEPTPEKRQPAPEPPSDLIEQIAHERVVPFVGAGFSKSARSRHPAAGAAGVMPTYVELLQQLLERAVISPQDQDVVRNLLGRDSNGDASHYDTAAGFLRKAMGEVRFYMTIRDILEPIDRDVEGSFAHQLLGGLEFRRLITVNYDRLLEGFTAPRHEMITPNDQRAFQLFMTDTRRCFILKLHGDITRPDTIPWGMAELLRYYGYDSYGNQVPDAELPPRTLNLRQFLRDLFRDNSVLFLGTSLSTSEGFAQILVKLVSDWGGSLPHRHYALVPHDPALKALRDDISRRMNLTYVYYQPDAQHSQVWEFIASLRSGRPRPEIKPGGEWQTWYLQRERPLYLLTQGERERTATEVRYLTPKLTNAIATPEFISLDCRAELVGRYVPAIIDQIVAAMLQRSANLESRLRGERLQVRVLFLEDELRRSLDVASASEPAKVRRAISRYEHLLALERETGFEFRLIPTLIADELKRREASELASCAVGTGGGLFPFAAPPANGRHRPGSRESVPWPGSRSRPAAAPRADLLAPIGPPRNLKYCCTSYSLSRLLRTTPAPPLRPALRDQVFAARHGANGWDDR
jgi:SIR2-like domain